VTIPTFSLVRSALPRGTDTVSLVTGMVFGLYQPATTITKDFPLQQVEKENQENNLTY